MPLIVLGAVYKLTPTFISVSDQLVTQRERQIEIERKREIEHYSTLIYNDIFRFSNVLCHKCNKNEQIIILIKIKIR